jgi:serine/threonine protein kinase
LKPDNVGFTSDGELKLFDFGLVTCVRSRVNSNAAYEMTGYTGSLRYMAPEVALRLPYTEKVDVYSFAIMVWQMARDRVPFKGIFPLPP